MLCGSNSGSALVCIDRNTWAALPATDVPVDFLRAFQEAYRRRAPVACRFDDGESSYIVVLGWPACYVIQEEPQTRIIELSSEIGQMAKELSHDIKTRLTFWANWPGCRQRPADRRVFLKQQAKILAALVKKHDAMSG